jgi:hypothetical protein
VNNWLHNVLLETNTERVEIASSVISLGWAVLLFGPFDLLKPPQYQALRLAVPEPVNAELFWGLVMAALGVGGILSLWKCWAPGRRAAMLLQAATWASICVSFVSAQIVLTGLVTYPVLCLSCIFAFTTLWRGGK